MKLHYSTKALLDMDAIAERIQKDSSRSALRFLEEAEKTAMNLVDFPEFGALWESDDPELKDLRVCLISGFEKYLLFYGIKGDKIVVTRIIHGHRNLPEALKE
jgi:addiction module RelE/StbE family toxin